jgi:hypothetical protein
MVDLVESPIGTIPTIPIDAGGLFTPGAAYAIKLNADIVNGLFSLAQTKTDDFDASIDALTHATTGWLTQNKVDDIATGSITAASPTEPGMTLADTSTALVINDFTTAATTLVNDLYSRFSAFINTWFPDESDTYAAAEEWLVNAIHGTASDAIPASVRSTMLQDGLSEIAANEAKALEEVDDAWAARRHPLPSGAQTYAALRINMAALDASAALTRSLTIRDFELTYQKCIDAVRMALANRQTVLTSAREYLAYAVTGNTIGLQATDTAHQAQVRKLSAAYEAYAKRINASELMLKISQADKALAFEADKANQMKDIKNVDSYVNAFITQAQMLAHQVTAMLNNVRAGGSSSYSVST